MLLLQVNHKRTTGHMRMIITHSPLQRSIKSTDVGTVPLYHSKYARELCTLKSINCIHFQERSLL